MRLITPTSPFRVVVSKMLCMVSGKEVRVQEIVLPLSKEVIKISNNGPEREVLTFHISEISSVWSQVWIFWAGLARRSLRNTLNQVGWEYYFPGTITLCMVESEEVLQLYCAHLPEASQDPDFCFHCQNSTQSGVGVESLCFLPLF